MGAMSDTNDKGKVWGNEDAEQRGETSRKMEDESLKSGMGSGDDDRANGGDKGFQDTNMMYLNGDAGEDGEEEDVVGELLPWRKRFWYQFSALSYKQLLVYGRSTRATIMRLLAPLFFMLLLWLLDIAVRSDNAAVSSFDNNPNPSVDPVDPIPSCSKDVFLKEPCYDFIFSPNSSEIARSIADSMRLNNPGREIPEENVKSFLSISDANEWMLRNPAQSQGGVHFLYDANAPGNIPEVLDATSDIGFVLQFNSTPKYFKANFQDPTFYASTPLQVAVEREISRFQWERNGGNPTDLLWNVTTSQFAHPLVGSFDIVGRAMGPFVFAANMFNFILLLSSIIAERERGLRQALTTSGMLDSAFWASWILIEVIIAVIFSLLLIGFGAMFSFEFFLRNSFGVVFLLFVTFQWAMTGFAFILSAFISKTSTAINMGFVIFILGWVIQSVIIFGFPYTPDYIDSIVPLTAIFTLLPFAPLAKASLDLGDAVRGSRDGISWGRRYSYCKDIQDPNEIDSVISTNPEEYWDFDCVFPVGTVLAVLAIEFIAYILIAIYLDNVFANENGVRKKPWYLFSASYWGLSRKERKLQPPVACPQKELEQDPDVAAEASAMKDLLLHRTTKAGGLAARDIKSAFVRNVHGENEGYHTTHRNAVEVFGLQKRFGRRSIWRKIFRRSIFKDMGRIFHRRKVDSNATVSEEESDSNLRTEHISNPVNASSNEFWAIKGSWFSIRQGKLFCLLGPNGAGKTTTINCLTGVLPPTGGDALIYGESITAPGGLDRIRSTMGVCPQFDVLWGELTGMEHLHIYGRVKGMTVKETKMQAYDLLEAVKLTAAANQRTDAYSGGMRRRLSVAVSLLGDPKIVYLDEPTTGMDPISRRHVWDAIEAFKPGRAIVLTTHSMEEADILGDEIAIMARGWIKAFGTSLRLKQRFGSGYHLSVAISDATTPLEESKKPVDKTNHGVREVCTDVSMEDRRNRILQFFEERLNIAPYEERGTFFSQSSYLIFSIPNEKVRFLPDFLEELELKRAELYISDVQISLTSLEDVFLNIARKAELESAVQEGRSTQTIVLEDGTELEVDLGADEVVQESTGRKFVITWAQDENGSLQIMSSKEKDD